MGLGRLVHLGRRVVQGARLIQHLPDVVVFPTESEQVAAIVNQGRALVDYYVALADAVGDGKRAGKTVYVGLIYNAFAAKWDCVAVSEEA